MHSSLLVFTCVCLITSVPGSGLPELPDQPANTSKEPGEVGYAAVKQINASDVRPFRKRPASVVQYQISLDNETFTITLRPNENLFSPGCLIHTYLPGGERDMYPCSHESVDCYYTGRSDIHNDSWVAANVCNGLNGVISFDNTSLFIEPVSVNSSSEEVHEALHVVYRYQGDKQICPINAKLNNLHVVYGRKKRSTQTRYIETRLVIDPTMYHFHKSHNNAVTYTLLAFNIASKLYAQPSIGTKIYLTLSELHVIKTYNNFASELTENANRSLQTFCEWQAGLTTKADCSVLLTRLDLEDDDGKRGINGLSHLNNMCVNNMKCALVEDEGPIMGITLAHEIGHLLGMTHDNFENGVGIMSAGGWSGNEAFTWSNQSATELQKSLTAGRMSCLENRPYGFTEYMKLPLPGQLYTAEEQCKMRNKSYMFYRSSFSKTDPCRNMKCSFRGTHALRFSAPLLDGTDCNNTRTWCIHGECVAIDGQHNWVAPVDGGWSGWEPDFSACSRSCGGGVHVKKRYCNNPLPQYGGKICSGPSFRGKICNTQACESDYRSLQCSMIKYPYTLVPALGYSGDESCIVLCQSDDGVVSTHRSYKDGTECLLSKDVPFSRCLNGKCQEFGCDGYSNSGLKFDECGVCNGTGSTCEQKSGTYNESAIPWVYTDVTTIPAGSSGIRIQQRNRYCFLSMLVDGKRILNTRRNKSDSALFNLYGVQFRYISYPETVEIVGKTKKDIIIQVLRLYNYLEYPNVKPDIVYTYHTPSPEAHQQYAWAEIPNQSCSKSCGTGVACKGIKCMSVKGHFVDEYHCDSETKPKLSCSSCNTQSCPPSWKTSEWGPCSVPCGTGTKSRNVTCVRTNNGVDKVISYSECKGASKPPLSSRCVINECGWRKGIWSKCTRTCGEGYQKRVVSCIKYNSSFTQIDSKYCDQDTRPADTARCRQNPCYVLDGTCVDKSPHCKKYYDYNETACDGSYRTWMITNCLKTCGVCGNGSCVDEETCKHVDPAVDACHNPTYTLWMQAHCPQSCNICRDCADCSRYDVKYCKDSNYEGYMRTYCRKTCKFC